MEAIVQTTDGSPDVLELRDSDKPQSMIAMYQYAFRQLASIKGTGS